MEFPFGECLTVHRVTTTVDAYGDQSDAGTTLVQVHGCAVEPVTSTTVVEAGRTVTVSSVNVYGPADVDLRAGDRVQRDGRWWRAIGNPQTFRSPFTGWDAGSRTAFEMVEG